ncbi:MAG: hypothetical protein VBE63_14130 [Lamprobacter sp.]|uniref:hypothetical protein n=1 Tax=Lamprobacter sp. TaxID=3100796 RepID=UPI002B25F129|nr:hypothetical protein [Lamprobacter sp.]MEA3641064.1 hypothetical protein [Lamprobacter sp.]
MTLHHQRHRALVMRTRLVQFRLIAAKFAADANPQPDTRRISQCRAHRLGHRHMRDQAPAAAVPQLKGDRSRI